MKKSLLSLAFIGVISTSQMIAQNELDGLRFSKTRHYTTARSMGVGGAIGAIGADPASISINPAALGLYRKNELNGSLNFNNPKVSSDYINEYYTQSLFSGNISNVSLVFSNMLYMKGRDPEDDIVGYSFSFQFNRAQNYANNTYFEGRNQSSSFLDMIWERSQGYDIFALGSLEYLSYYVRLLESANGIDKWDIPLEDNKRDIIQSGQVLNSGGLNDYSFGGGFNFGNKFYAGLSVLGYQLRFTEKTSYTENNLLKEEGFSTLDLRSNINSRGNGTGFKGGFIAKLTDEIRMGISFSTPVKIRITDNYSYDMVSTFSSLSSRFPGANSYEGREGPYEFKYATTTPSRTHFSLAYVTGRWGFLSLDLERVDYRTILMGSDFSSFLNENRKINRDFRAVTNARMGIELIKDDYRIRGGMAHYPSPYNAKIEEYKNRMREWSFSTGMGIRKKNYALDFGIMRTVFNDLYVPYLTIDLDYPSYNVNRKFNQIQFVVSLSYFFDEE